MWLWRERKKKFCTCQVLGTWKKSFQILENINGIYGRKNTVFCRSFLDFFSTFYFSQNVDEEKQHDWYKQMFKSLHKTGKKEGNQISPRKLNAFNSYELGQYDNFKTYLISILSCLGNINGVHYNAFSRSAGLACK